MKLPVRSNPRASRYDYSSSGVYFVTICTRDREEYFGKIIDKEMVLNEVGKICEKEIKNLNNRQTVDIHERIVMPNHVHLLLAMNERLSNEPRRDGSLNRPNKNKTLYSEKQGNICNSDSRDGSSNCPNTSYTHIDILNDADTLNKINCSDALTMRPYGYKGPTLGNIIKLFKGNVTKYTQTHNIPFARQSRYHDHIVRNEQAYNHIKHYIHTNPSKRETDQFRTEI